MTWNKLTDESQIETIFAESQERPVIIFKHSTTCSISNAALNRLERNWNSEQMASTKAYFLDLLSHRAVSNHVAKKFDVEHQSPQLLIIEKGQPVFVRSHFDIRYDEIQSLVGSKNQTKQSA